MPVLFLVDAEHMSNLGGKSYNTSMEVAMNPSLVSRDADVMSGALCFSGTRVPVQNLFDYLEGSSSLEDFLEDFPSVSRGGAGAVLEAARLRLYSGAPAS